MDDENDDADIALSPSLHLCARYGRRRAQESGEKAGGRREEKEEEEKKRGELDWMDRLVYARVCAYRRKEPHTLGGFWIQFQTKEQEEEEGEKKT